ncbi:MAG: hypothetical protein LBC07_03995, partial [Elusimicrobiota bacterium]|nr:hypothetical protein [Elusimicrobiota bacterium]
MTGGEVKIRVMCINLITGFASLLHKAQFSFLHFWANLKFRCNFISSIIKKFSFKLSNYFTYIFIFL